MSTKSDETLAHLGALWRREQAEARARFVAERRDTTLKERVARGTALADLAIDEVEPAVGERLLLWLSPRSASSGAIDRHRLKIGPGDPVLLYATEVEDKGTVRGVVTRFGRGGIGVMVGERDAEDLPDAGFKLDLDAPEVTFKRGAGALRRWQEAKPSSDEGALREVIYGERELETLGERDARVERMLDPALNEAQAQAVAHALRTWPIASIHGPPGTGKTRTVVEIIRQGVARGWKILATAASNIAVDNIAERLVEAGVPIARLGHPARVLPSVEAHTLDAQVDASDAASLGRAWIAEANATRKRIEQRARRGQISWRERREELRACWDLYRDARTQLRGAREAVLARQPVILATAAGADSRDLAGIAFDLVVLDEATQAPDPLALIALGRGPRAVLAGDPCQLSPTVLDRVAEREGLGTTIFERVHARFGEAVTRMLVVQHRMHETLMRYPSDALYDGRLVCADGVRGHRLEDIGVAEDPLRPGPLLFIDTAGKGWTETRPPDDPSARNVEQAARTAAEATRLLGRGLAPAELAIITPYDAQARILKDRLSRWLDAGLEIGTVDGFQGREKEAIIVDLVRSNERGELGFLSDVRRMNVAMTRARRLLIVIGDSATLGGHAFYAGFIAHAERVGGYLSAWNDDAEPFAPVDSGAG